MKTVGRLLWLVLAAVVLPLGAAAAQRQEARIPVTVTADGTVQDAVYTVELEALTPGCPMPEGSIGNTYRLELRSEGTICIPCESLGVYDYRIRQLPPEDPACTGDDRQYRLRLYVTAEGVTALLYDRQEEKVDRVRFHDHWAEPVSLVLRALKTLDGRTPEDGAFSFRLISESGEVLYEAANRGRHVTFPVMVFDSPGTWRFFLKEVKGSNGKILYDRTVYTVIVEVTLDGDYRAAVRYERNGKPYTGTPAFANYTDTGSPKTGDRIGLWLGMLAASAAGLAGAAAGRKRKKR